MLYVCIFISVVYAVFIYLIFYGVKINKSQYEQNIDDNEEYEYIKKSNEEKNKKKMKRIKEQKEKA